MKYLGTFTIQDTEYEINEEGLEMQRTKLISDRTGLESIVELEELERSNGLFEGTYAISNNSGYGVKLLDAETLKMWAI